MRPLVTAALDQANALPDVNTPTQIRLAQQELARLGCFSGNVDGALGPATTSAVQHYESKRGQPAESVDISDTFISELKAQSTRVCPLVCPKGKVADGEQCIAAEKPPVLRIRRMRKSPRRAPVLYVRRMRKSPWRAPVPLVRRMRKSQARRASPSCRDGMVMPSLRPPSRQSVSGLQRKHHRIPVVGTALVASGRQLESVSDLGNQLLARLLRRLPHCQP